MGSRTSRPAANEGASPAGEGSSSSRARTGVARDSDGRPRRSPVEHGAAAQAGQAALPTSPSHDTEPDIPYTMRPDTPPPVDDSPSFLSLFLPPRKQDLTHTHFRQPEDELAGIAITLQRKGLPSELAMRVMDMAECYTACRIVLKRSLTVLTGAGPIRRTSGLSTVMDFTNDMEGQEDISQAIQSGGLQDKDGEAWYLASGRVGCSMLSDSGRRRWWLKKVVVETLSRDQGWSSNSPGAYGTYEHSYSWFEVSLLRDGQEVPGTRTSIQNNVHAGQFLKAHLNTLDDSHAVVRMAQEGDRVILWARAQYPGWRNFVREAAITIYCAPYSS